MLVNEVLDKRLNKMKTRVSFCTKCVNSNQRFGFKFDKKGNVITTLATENGYTIRYNLQKLLFEKETSFPEKLNVAPFRFALLKSVLTNSFWSTLIIHLSL